jgi:hypothetical protein
LGHSTLERGRDGCASTSRVIHRRRIDIMQIEKYEYVSKSNHRTFSFISRGPKGSIKKIVSFRQMKDWNENIYNLSFGDWDEVNQGINDKVVSNNGDREKILKTVVVATLEFSKYFPNAFIYFEGSTDSRTRLYQMRISQYYPEICKLYDIYGFRGGNWLEFESGKNFEAFLLSRKERKS